MSDKNTNGTRLVVYAPKNAGGAINPTIWRSINIDGHRMLMPLECRRSDKRYCNLQCGHLHVTYNRDSLWLAFGCQYLSDTPYTTVTVLNEDPPIV